MRDLSKIKTQMELVIFGLGKFVDATTSEVSITKEALMELVKTDLFDEDDVVAIVEKLEPLRESTKRYNGVKEASQLNGYIIKLYELLEVQDRVLQMEIEMYNAIHAEEQAEQEARNQEAREIVQETMKNYQDKLRVEDARTIVQKTMKEYRDKWEQEGVTSVNSEKYKSELTKNIEAVRKQAAGHFINEYYVVNLSVNGPWCIELLLDEMNSSLKEMFNFVGKELDSIQLDSYAPWNEKGVNDSVIYFVEDIDNISNKNWFAQRPGFNDLVADTKGRVMLRVNLAINELEKGR